MPKKDPGFEEATLSVVISRDTLRLVSVIAKVEGTPLRAVVDRELHNAFVSWRERNSVDEETIAKAMALVRRDEEES
jgi:hypothetical protein